MSGSEYGMQTNIDHIWKHLEWIASEPRFAQTDRLEECRAYCEQQLSEYGWATQRRPFRAVGSAGSLLDGINIACSYPGVVAPPKTFVLGAHLDSREDTPGADDNASAVAVLLEVARLMALRLAHATAHESVRTGLELVIFDLEEHGMLGGAHHAEECRRKERALHGMVSLEMLGYCSHDRGSQQFPPELADRFPDTGDFIGVVGNQNSAELIQQFCRGFERIPDLPCEFLQVPDDGLSFPPTRLSDHSPFWDEGFPAVMVTDTSYMRNPHYHMPSDTPDTLDKAFLHKVAEGVLEATTEIVFGAIATA